MSIAALTEDLLAFQSVDDREWHACGTILEFLDAHPDDPFSRDHLAAHLTASALVVSHDGERVLLGHHRKLGRWLQFGGHGDPGEIDAAAVAMREALEESGIEGLKFHPTAARPFDLDVHTIPARGDVPEHEHLDIRYLVVAPADAVPAMREAEHLELQWFSWDEADALEIDRALARLFRKGRQEIEGPRREAAIVELRRKLFEAFKDVPTPPPDAIATHDCDECRTYQQDLRVEPGKTWMDVPADILDRYPVDICLITPLALPFYCAAYMNRALEGWPVSADYARGFSVGCDLHHMLPGCLCPSEQDSEGFAGFPTTTAFWFQCFTGPQRSVVYDFLKFAATYTMYSHAERYREGIVIFQERLESPSTA